MPRHTAIRTCAACRRQQDKRLLTRFVITKDGLRLDETGKMNGRGAYLCSERDCRQKAATTDLLARALRQPFQSVDRQFLAEWVSRTNFAKENVPKS